MRRLAFLFALLLATPLFAASKANIVDDVIRMQRAGVAEENIVEFIHKSDGRFDVTADDVIALTDAKVSRTVIHALLEERDTRNGGREREERVTTRVVAAPYWGLGYGFYDPFWYDPFWYGPRVSVGLRFGGYYGGHFGGHRGGGHFRRGRH